MGQCSVTWDPGNFQLKLVRGPWKSCKWTQAVKISDKQRGQVGGGIRSFTNHHPLHLSLDEAQMAVPPPSTAFTVTSVQHAFPSIYQGFFLAHHMSIFQHRHDNAPLHHLGLVGLLLFPWERSSHLPLLKGPLAVMTTADECADSHNLLLFHPSSL